MIYGYARVSTRDQETHLQLDALASAGALEVRQEKASSVGARPELQRMLRELRPGDVVIVYKLDRMARSLADLLNILDKIKHAGASIRSITEPIDTAGPYGLFMLQVLGAVAQLERSIIRERSIAGQVAFMQRGGKFGRPKKLTEDQEKAVFRMRENGATLTSIADHFHVSLAVIRRIIDEARGKSNTGKLPILKRYMGP